jgi:hypothetical protein
VVFELDYVTLQLDLATGDLAPGPLEVRKDFVYSSEIIVRAFNVYPNQL